MLCPSSPVGEQQLHIKTMRSRRRFVAECIQSSEPLYILPRHHHYWHFTEKTVGDPPVISSLFLQKALESLLFDLKLRNWPIPLYALLLFLIMAHPVSSYTLNCTVDEVPGVYDGLPACRADSCRAKYKEKKPYWCDSIRLCVTGPDSCFDPEDIPGVPPRSPPPPADPYSDPLMCVGAHIRGFDRSTNSCLCEEGWYTTPNPYYCDSQEREQPSMFFVYIFPEEDSTPLVITIFILAGILAMCIMLCYISTVKSVVKSASFGSSINKTSRDEQT